MLERTDLAEAALAANPAAIHFRDSHGRTALDAATLLDSFRRSRGGLRESNDQVARLLIQHGASVQISHAASLGRLENVRHFLELDPDVLRRPVKCTALIGGTAMMESPLSAAKRRGWSDVVNLLVEHGAVDAPAIEWSSVPR